MNRHHHVVLGITGGIAAYKSADLVRRLQDQGAEVRVVMTPAATEFVSPMTFQALSGHPVWCSWQDGESDFGMDHIALARWADTLLIAPTTADFLAKLAGGFADDVLSTLCLATKAPVFVAPAMNQAMWHHPATVHNSRILAHRGVHFLGPAEGSQACGDEGIGRMLDPTDIVSHLQSHWIQITNPPLRGLNVMVTAGPTQEAIDPVRFISNHSSGKMGYAFAQAAAQLGATVTLISGPSVLPSPTHVKRECVTSGREMYAAVMKHLPGCHIFIGAAAVADYYCAEPQRVKLKRKNVPLTLELIPNPDILQTVAHSQPRPFTVGFAAETDQVIEHARQKLHAKQLDMLIANDVSQADSGFYQDNNAVTVLWGDQERVFGLRPKLQLAYDVWSVITDQFRKMIAGQVPT